MKRRFSNRLDYEPIWLSLGILMIAVVWVLSLIPHPPQIGFENEDKFAHIIAYGALMLWWSQIVIGLRERVILAACLIAMGILIEFVQGWTGWRTFDTHDMIANAAGVGLGWCLACTPAGSVLARLELGAMRR